MRAIHNWRTVLRFAWSVRLMILAAFLSGLEVALPLIDSLFPIHPGIFAALSFVTVVAAFIARIVVQKDISHEDQA